MASYNTVWSKPEKTRKQTPLVVLLHGYAANEYDLVGLFDMLPAHITYLSVRAPIPVNTGYTWFPISDNLQAQETDILAASTNLLNWLKPLFTQHTNISVLGFSMGMAIATNLLRHSPESFKCIIGLSGFVTNTQFSQDTKLTAKQTPYFWARDPKDPIIPEEHIIFSQNWLKTHTQLTKVFYENMGHSLCEAEIRHVTEFLNFHTK